MSQDNWTVAEAKARFSEVIEKAKTDGPQTITRHGRTAAVIVGADEWERKSKRVGNLATQRVGYQSPAFQGSRAQDRSVSFLLDTNVLSEGIKPRPNAGVIAWLAGADEDRLFISAVTLAELGYGIERLAAGHRRNRLTTWLRDELTARFESRVLPVDAAVADAWSKTVARREAAGRPIGIMDAFIVATAEVHGLTLVTRNAADFSPSLGDIVNPWTRV